MLLKFKNKYPNQASKENITLSAKVSTSQHTITCISRKSIVTKENENRFLAKQEELNKLINYSERTYYQFFSVLERAYYRHLQLIYANDVK